MRTFMQRRRPRALKAGARCRGLAGLGVVLWALGLLVAGAGFAASESESLLVIVPLADVLETSLFDTCRGFELGPDQVLVILSGEDSARLQGRLALAGQGLGTIGPRPAERLWVCPKPIASDVALEVGVRVIRISPANTLFEASRDNASRLLERGYFVTEVDFRPLADLKQPHFGPGMTEALLGAHPMTEARRAFVKAVAESVKASNLRSTIYFLDYDEASAKYRSRCAPRHEMRGEVAPHLMDALGACVVPFGGTVRLEEFRPALGSQFQGDDSIFTNIIAEKPGGKTAARYIICSHYDSYAGRTAGWHWLTDPAPGADDNATGTAGVLECARLLSGLDLDFGLTFIAFSGEELGLLGSYSYVSGLAPDDSILGVINFDMLGYSAGDPRMSLVYDWKSKWLSDQMAEIASVLDLASRVDKVDLSGVANSDHSSFWRVGIPANLLIEKLDQNDSPINPYYHTLADTLGMLDTDLACDFVRLVSGYVARFANLPEDSLPDLALTDGSVEWKWEGRGYAPFIAGDSVTAVVRAINLGGDMTEPELYNFQICQGTQWTGWMMYDAQRTVQVPAGGYAEVTASWRTSPDTYGDIPFLVALRPMTQGIESDVTNNFTAASFDIMSPTVVLRDLHVFPNPVTDPAGAKLAFEILVPDNDFAGNLEVSVFDLEGQRVGGALLVRSHIGGKDISIGKNAVDFGQVLGSARDLPPGIYVCLAELKLTGGRGSASAKFKFAVAR